MIFFNIGRGSGNGVTTARDMDQILRSHVVPFVDRHCNYTFQMTTLVPIQQDPHIEVMPWPVLIPELKPIEHLWVRFKDDLAKPSQGRQLQLNTVHPSWWFGLVFLWDISFNVQEMCSALINDNVGHTRYWLSFLISSYSLMHCWQKFPIKVFQKLFRFRNLLEMTFRYLFLNLLSFKIKMFEILIYTTFLWWFSILRHCLCKHKNHPVHLIMPLYLSHVKANEFWLLDKD